MEVKKPYLSRTVWVNVLVAVLAIFGKSELILAHMDMVLAGFALVNIILRFASKDKISFGE